MSIGCGSSFDSKHPRQMGAGEVLAFLSFLANERKVAPSTHRQALAAILREVLKVQLPWMTEIARRSNAFACRSCFRGRKSPRSSPLLMTGTDSSASCSTVLACDSWTACASRISTSIARPSSSVMARAATHVSAASVPSIMGPIASPAFLAAKRGSALAAIV
jgi:hypothetical protein